MVGGDGVGDALQQHGLAGARRGYDQAALSLADGREQIHDAAGEAVAHRFELDPLVGIERRQVVEEDLVAGFLGRLEVDGIDFDEGEVPFAFLGRPDLAGDGVSGTQIEAAYLGGRHVHVVGAGQVVIFGRAQEAEAVRQAFEHAFGEDQAALLRLGLQDLEDQLLLAQSGGPGHVHILGHLVEPLDAHVLQFHQVQSGGAVLGLRGWFVAPVPTVVAGAAPEGLLGPFGGGLRARLGCRSGILVRGVGLVAGGPGDFAGRPIFAGRPFVRALGRLVLFFLRCCGIYRVWSVFVITCQISLTPRPVEAENGSGSTFSLRIDARPCHCSD